MATWHIDASHSHISFAVRHLMISTVRGQLGDVEGSLEGDPFNLTNSKIMLNLNAHTINTNNEDRDKHLRSEEFFDVQNYPHISFVSTEINEAGKDEYNVTGVLTIKGISEPTTFKVIRTGVGKNLAGVEVVAFHAKTEISRDNFEIIWNQALEAGGVLVSDEVEIAVDLEMNPA